MNHQKRGNSEGNLWEKCGKTAPNVVVLSSACAETSLLVWRQDSDDCSLVMSSWKMTFRAFWWNYQTTVDSIFPMTLPLLVPAAADLMLQVAQGLKFVGVKRNCIPFFSFIAISSSHLPDVLNFKQTRVFISSWSTANKILLQLLKIIQSESNR
jgi:hypothetical protein